MVILIKIGILVLLVAAAQWGMNISNNKMTYGIIRDIRKEAFQKIEILPLKYIDSHSYGEVVSRVIADVDQFADGLLMGFTQLFTGIITILGTLAFMLSVNAGITRRGGPDHTGLPFCGKLHCEKNLFHVQTAVGDPRGTDRADRRNDREPESGPGFRTGSEESGAVRRDKQSG